MARYPVPSHQPQGLRNLTSRLGGALPPGSTVTYVAVGQASETNTAQAVAWAPKHRLANLASETNAAFAITRVKTVPVGLASEADTAFPIAVVKTRAVGLAEETDSAFAVGKSKVKAIGLTDEPNTAFALTLVRVYRTKVVRATQAFSSAQVLLGPRIIESRVTSTELGVGLATEVNEAQPIGKAKAKEIGLTSETDVAFALTRLKTIAVGLASETDTATATGKAKVKAIGLASETDTALDVDADPYARLVGLATETDTAFDIGTGITAPAAPTLNQAVVQPRQELRTLGSRVFNSFVPSGSYTYEYFPGMETDTAFSITVVRSYPVGVATDTQTSQPVAWAPKHRLVNQAVETDTALVISSELEPYLPPPTVHQGKQQETLHLHERSTVVGGLLDTGGSQYGPPSYDGSTPNIAIHAGGSRTTSGANVISAVPAFNRQEPLDPVSQVIASVNTPGPWQVANEVDEALMMTVIKTLALGVAIDTSTALQMTRGTGVWTAGSATETDTAFALTIQRNRYVPVGIVSETDTALAMTVYTYGPRTIPVGVTQEIDAALDMRVVSVSEPVRNRQFARYSLKNQRR